MWLFFLFLIVMVVFIILRVEQDSRHEVFSTLAIISGIITAIFATIWVCSYTNALDGYGELIAYQKEVQQYYNTAVSETKSAVVELDKRGPEVSVAPDGLVALAELDISLENLYHSSRIADRIQERRDYFRDCQEKLHQYRLRRKHWFTRQFIPKLPKELEVK